MLLNVAFKRMGQQFDSENTVDRTFSLLIDNIGDVTNDKLTKVYTGLR